MNIIYIIIFIIIILFINIILYLLFIIFYWVLIIIFVIKHSDTTRKMTFISGRKTLSINSIAVYEVLYHRPS